MFIVSPCWGEGLMFIVLTCWVAGIDVHSVDMLGGRD